MKGRELETNGPFTVRDFNFDWEILLRKPNHFLTSQKWMNFWRLFMCRFMCSTLRIQRSLQFPVPVWQAIWFQDIKHRTQLIYPFNRNLNKLKVKLTTCSWLYTSHLWLMIFQPRKTHYIKIMVAGTVSRYTYWLTQSIINFRIIFWINLHDNNGML